MKSMTWLGTGAAFTMNNRQSNILLTSDTGKNLLLDAGSDVRHSLWRVDKSVLDIDGVYISHLHADHIGGMEWLALMTFFDPRYKGKSKLFIHESLRTRLWKNCLSGGLETLQTQVADLNTFFSVEPVLKNGCFCWEGTEFQLVQTVHVVSGREFENSYGLLFEVNGRKIFFTSDTQFAPNQMKDFYNQADIIFQDCETLPFKSGVHAHYSELVTLPEETKKKMFLYHYNDGELPDAEADGFLGFVRQGQIFDFDTPNFEHTNKVYVSEV
jgi:ribonuclease BN (tRNA processing enzyme)